MKEKILWAVKIGDPDYMEQIITTNESQFKEARAWAESNGFDRFRVAEIDLATPPDFTKTINL